MNEAGKVIIISGPAGAGKTTLSERITKEKNWVLVSEDNAWVEIKRGHPVDEQRTEKEEDIVQTITLNKILEIIETGTNVVLEFILYRNPPKPIIFYHNALTAKSITVDIRLLKPNENEIWERKTKRGYAWDKNEIEQRGYATHQLGCLDSDYFHPDWIIDNSNLSPEETFEKYFKCLIS